jgi:ATP-dependent metalloprotease FtsH
MFTEKAQAIIDHSKECAFSRAKEELDIDALLAAVGSDTEAGIRLAQCLTNGDVPSLRARCPDLGCPAPCPGSLNLAEPLREIIVSAKTLASTDGIPDRVHPGLIDIRHLVCAIALSREACRQLGDLDPMVYEDAVKMLVTWYATEDSSPSLTELISHLRGLRAELQRLVFGQDHAIHAFVEALYNAELTAAADRERKRPAAVFVFAGPPGVGKTYMAELCSSFLERPFKRFDMTGYSDHQADNVLVGWAPSYKDAKPGYLTGFVEQNPNAILLFDEIEKAHLTTIQLFYQILDAGRLEDKYLGRDVNFRDTIIIFTTNAGRSLYENPNKIGISAANSTYHKRTILNALENEKNPANGMPAFPQPICSRLAQGYPIMFNNLGINELERVCNAALERTDSLLENQYFKSFSHDPVIPLCLVLKEGGRVDARQLRSEAEKFVKSELFKFFSLYKSDNLEDAFEEIDHIHFEMEGGLEAVSPEVQSLFEVQGLPKVLLIASDRFASLCRKAVPQIQWICASSSSEIIDALSNRDVDLVLLDLWARPRNTKTSPSQPEAPEENEPDFIPLSARALDYGREILSTIHQRAPQIPVYLLSFTVKDSKPSSPDADIPSANDPGIADVGLSGSTITSYLDSFVGDMPDSFEEAPRRPIDDELFLACVRAGGARGLLTTGFVGRKLYNWEAERDRFVENLVDINRRLYREKKARSLAQERKVLNFETYAELKKEERLLTIRLRGFSLVRTVDAADAGELIDDIERPATSLDDVLGAKLAKERLGFIIEWLKDPKRFSALGVRQPKGYLLAGPPGTGKTMLARAVAGESQCAFIETAANTFVTMWQGSGPQNVRNLFERARRYAPTVVFIDEIDAIGTVRTGGGSGRAEEKTLNAILTEMDGFRVRKDQPVIVLAATNLADRLDEALRRRFDDIIEVDKPDKEARLQYLEREVMKRQSGEVSQKTLQRIAGQSAGMTIADLERILHQAGVKAARKESPLTDQLLEEAFEEIRMGEAKDLPDRDTLTRIARHEGGHTLIAWLGGNPPVQVTIVGRGGAGGYMEREADETRIIYTKADLEQRIREAMAGRAAEMIYYGNDEGLSTGVSGDLSNATHWASKMVREYGMSDEFGQIAIRETAHLGGSADGPLSAKAAKSAERIVRKQLDMAREMLEQNRSHLDLLCAELLEKNRLTREDLDSILPPLSGA